MSMTSVQMWWRAAECGLLLVLAGCGSESRTPAADSGDSQARDGGDASGGSRPADAGLVPLPDAAGPASDQLVVEPADSTVTLGLGEHSLVQFTATIRGSGASASSVRWGSDDETLGTIDKSTGVFTPTGAGGTVRIVATAHSLQTSTTLRIRVSAKQNGDPDANSMPAGAGGLGGVGGEGGGSKLEDGPLLDALDKAAAVDPELIWLYPYDGTVWPRGLPAPLLQWRAGSHAARAVKIEIEVDDTFEYDGYFGPPSGLATNQPITRVPIPQHVWRTALQSGKTLKVRLVIAASDSAGNITTHTPAKNLTWTIAPTTLRGTVYYNSYGTKLAENHGGAKGGNGRFGGATLAIRRDAFDPTLVAGATTNDQSGCRVCHVVSADGSRMIVQQSNNLSSSAYDLKNMNRESPYPAADNGKFGWAALSPDAAIALGNAGPPGSNQNNRSSLDTSALYRVSDAAALTARGLSEFVTQAATPSFSVDGAKIAFNFAAGPGTVDIAADGRSLVVMDFSKVDDVTYQLANPKAVFKADADQRPGWPFFLPDAKGLIFQLQLEPGSNGEHFATRLGARGKLWWTDLEGQAHALDRANGEGYLPSAPAGHADDTSLQYEPTVAPVVAGGYAWVVFTSRRLYGNVATRDPFESDARSYDLTQGNASGPTTKKLWVTAIDMPPKPGTDPSHPAFYLPAQELYAGNSRGFWVLDACMQKGTGCGGGDECCGGYCRVDPEFGGKVCTDVPPSTCAMEYDVCNVDSDCCAGNARLSCLAGRCAQLIVL